ncbi:MAG: 2-oxoacid:ferredoxin oxidoreductase subunit beta [Nitrospirae bacterium]|nr:2-oxoacid:ferredoxin oxidoreductase subunit beta [Nitrospirota bacterium]
MGLKYRTEYRTDRKVTWCPGCGDFGVLDALCDAFSRTGLDPAQTVLVTGNGCSSMIGFFVKTYAMHGLHGRALPMAWGVKLANPSLKVIVAGGDGDAFAVGAGHLVHIARRNPDLTYLIMDNGCYGLTRGQPSPTARRQIMAGENGVGQPINPVALLITAGATFVAQGYSEDPKSLRLLIQEALNHRGFAVVNILSSCPTFNRQDEASLNRPEFLYIETTSHPVHDRLEALRLAMTEEDRPRVGVFYRKKRGVPDERPKGAGSEDRRDDLTRLGEMMDELRP